MNMRILVTGGAGYIGSHTCKELAKAGHDPVVLDDLSNGNQWAVRWGPLLRVDLADKRAVFEILREYEIEGVVHLAALADVGESMRLPADYFRANLINTLGLLDAMLEADVKRIVFSSTCAVYGAALRSPLTENQLKRPINPYGESKLMVEQALSWYERAYGLDWIALRYFNAAGADLDGEIGEAHNPETHLVPRAIAAVNGDIPALRIFGNDHKTPDGTAVRDYVHVSDLAAAHVKAFERLLKGAPSGSINLGTGHGSSVREVVAMVEKISQRQVPVAYEHKRSGDPDVLVADATFAKQELDWRPCHSSLDEIVESAWRWHSRNESRPKHLRQDCTTECVNLQSS